MTIDKTKFTTPVLIYGVKSETAVLSWTDADAKNKLGLTICGSLTWTVTNTDGLTAIDSAVFTENYTLTTKTLSTYTTDFAKAGTYNMLAKVCYSELGLTSICGTQTFSIVVKNPCLTDTLKIDAT